MKNIVVTGSSGQLGQEIVILLRNKGYHVLGVDIIDSETTHNLIDIRDPNKVNELLQGFDAVIHTAAIHGKHYAQKFPRKDFIETNINGTFNLLNSCINNNISKFLYISTTSIYGEAMVNSHQAVWVDEKLVPDPRDIYDITKLTAELLCKDFFDKEGLEATVLRVSRFLPEDDNTKSIHRLYRGLDEKDGATSVLLALEKKFAQFEIFNISNKSPFKKGDLQLLLQNPKEAILKHYPEAEAIFKAKDWSFPSRIDRVYDISKAQRELNFQPIYNFDHFLK